MAANLLSCQAGGEHVTAGAGAPAGSTYSRWPMKLWSKPCLTALALLLLWSKKGELEKYVRTFILDRVSPHAGFGSHQDTVLLSSDAAEVDMAAIVPEAAC